MKTEKKVRTTKVKLLRLNFLPRPYLLVPVVMNEHAVLGRPSTCSNDDVDFVRALRLEGFSWTGIAAYFNTTRQSLCRFV